MRNQSQEFDDVRIILPDVMFERGVLNIYLGGKTIRLQHCPGHSPDLISAMAVEDKILFASDTVMPVPTIFDGNYDALVKSLSDMRESQLVSVVQGHGEVILKGEIDEVIGSDLSYLRKIKEAVGDIVDQGLPISALETISIESCGKSRIPLNGFVTDLHHANLRKLYLDSVGEPEAILT
jgi:glyoxylase-like metal-dependent hydrolase (beta-lactamase superfamily II)